MTKCFLAWSSILKLPFELVVYLCVVLGPTAWAACLGFFILSGAPLSRFFLSVGVGVVSQVVTLLVWKRWFGYPVRVPLYNVVRLWCAFVWREILQTQLAKFLAKLVALVTRLFRVVIRPYIRARQPQEI